MEVFIDLLTILGYSIVLFVLGLIIGFSPTLYVTLVAVVSKAKRPMRQGIALLLGITLGIVLLILFSEIIQPDVIFAITHDALLAFRASQWLNYVLGIVFIGIGLRYILTRHRQPKPSKSTSAAASSGLFMFGMLKTMASVKSIASLVLVSSLITKSDDMPLLQIFYFCLMMAGVLLPFIAILALYYLRPGSFAKLQHRFAGKASQNSRTYIGIALITIGSLLIILELIG